MVLEAAEGQFGPPPGIFGNARDIFFPLSQLGWVILLASRGWRLVIVLSARQYPGTAPPPPADRLSVEKFLGWALAAPQV